MSTPTGQSLGKGLLRQKFGLEAGAAIFRGQMHCLSHYKSRIMFKLEEDIELLVKLDSMWIIATGNSPHH
mgnify:CR=1 FL=1